MKTLCGLGQCMKNVNFRKVIGGI
ncbi:hypothetical protein Golob_025924, partial [Gossypium lobatum]|nr:hypothetical protein [Gossypium lobatum]